MSKAEEVAIQLDKMLRPELYAKQVADLRESQRRNDEHQRLKDAVVEAAKAWGTTNYRLTDLVELREDALSAAVDALLHFEEIQGK